jgi:exonuclease III
VRCPGPPGWGFGWRLTTSSSKTITVKKPKVQPRIGRTDGGRTGNVKRTMIKDVIMATWNVRTMMQPARMQDIANEMIKNKIRWQGQGKIDKQAYTVIYSGLENRTGQLGTGFMITKLMRASLLEFEAVSDRICRIRLKGKYRNIRTISTHAPIYEKEEHEKEKFYDRLEEICNKVQKYDIIIVIGDFNEKI